MDQRINFWTLFQATGEGKITPRVILNVNGVVIGPGVSIGPGSYVGGIDFFKILGRDISVHTSGNVYFIKGYYGTPVIF